ncbi:MAG: anhydro-N-acetylmuramic acid kinase [Planctomycetota bacterium]|nr:anhydro-N-acetylmuramic acid kinase [Planctomycetota bacterium]
MLPRFADLQRKTAHRVVGLMSGTSADGVDAALCELSGEGRGGLKVKLLAEHTQPYPDSIRERILRACEPQGGSAAELCELNFLIGEAFACAANAVLDAAHATREDVDLIGSHGQTISHIPPRTGGDSFQLGATLQLGEPAVIAERTGIAVVSNFRTRDMAAGGQGAPLVPFVDYLLFSSDDCSRMTLNIGGISNVTFLPARGQADDIIAYDTGPGNMIVDAMVQYMTDGEQSYDKDGAIAASGTINCDLLNEMLQHEFLRRPPPKSTGREEFGAGYARAMYNWGAGEGKVIQPRDVVATATRFTALTIADSLKKFVFPKGAVDELIISGGGALNPVLMQHLANELPRLRITTSDQYGLPVKAKESIAFAILARETALGRPSNLPSATGAAGPRILGQITP